MYADDTVIYDADANLDNVYTRMQQSLDDFGMWCLQNKLTVNTGKTKIMAFTASKQKLTGLHIDLSLNGVKLMVVPSYKYLGVVLDPHLKYDLHVKQQLKSINHKTWILANLRGAMTKSIALKIFSSKIVPYFDYGDQLFCSAAQYILDDLQYAQNRCLKICLKVDHLTDTEFVHAKAKIPMLKYRRLAHLHNFMYKRAQNLEYTVNRNIPTRAHQAPILNRHTSHCDVYFRSIEHYGSMVWNMIPPPVRLLPTYDIFKRDRKLWLENRVPIIVRI